MFILRTHFLCSSLYYLVRSKRRVTNWILQDSHSHVYLTTPSYIYHIRRYRFTSVVNSPTILPINGVLLHHTLVFLWNELKLHLSLQNYHYHLSTPWAYCSIIIELVACSYYYFCRCGFRFFFSYIKCSIIPA